MPMSVILLHATGDACRRATVRGSGELSCPIIAVRGDLEKGKNAVPPQARQHPREAAPP
jgi:hypothetical protein